jgi:Sulfotransferase family
MLETVDRFRRRRDARLHGAFAKDSEEERFLERLNEILAPCAEADLLDLDEAYPTLHIVGAPRSGTTLLHQVVASGLEVGYVNTLVASFWRAPLYGVALSRKLGLDEPRSSFVSRFGRTQGVQEPHEFGYFWNDHLRYPDLSERPPGHEDTIDWAHLRRVLVNMAHASGRPMVFKPMLLVWHLQRMAEVLPRTCYLWIRREPKQTALSLLAMRRALYGDLGEWASLRPGGPDWLAGEPPWRQVAAQVVALERSLDRAYEQLGDESMLTLRYEELCASPRRALERIRGLLGSKGFAPALRDCSFPTFSERRSELEDEFGARVEEALEHYTSVQAEPQAAGGVG